MIQYAALPETYMHAGDYSIPAFAGMTALARGATLSHKGRGNIYARLEEELLHPHRHQHVERALGTVSYTHLTLPTILRV